MEIKVLGPGCKNCNDLFETVTDAARELGLDVEVQKVTDILQITMSGVMSTPGLVVNGKLLHQGKPLPSVEKVTELIKQEV